MKKLVYRLLESDRPGRLGRMIRLVIGLLIVMNVVGIIVESHFAPGDPVRDALWGFELLSVIVFTTEYLLRLWAITESAGFSHPITGRLRFVLSPLALVDLIAIVPFYIPFLTSVDLRVARLLRVVRLMRIFKLNRYSRAMRRLGSVIATKKADLASAFVVVVVLLIIASCLMFYAEHPQQPDKFPNISASIWWGVATLTTVGYGDVYPVTEAGKVIAGIISVLGVGVFAMPAGIIADGYREVLGTERVAMGPAVKDCPDCAESVLAAARVCRHCGFRWALPPLANLSEEV